MTRYTVVWVQSAQNELADIWLNATDRNAVTVATQLIDQELSENAPTKGNDLSEGLRSLFAPPIKVIFTVRKEDRLTEVLLVRII